MVTRPFRTLGVIGAGTMGTGIAQMMAANGFDVILVDVGDLQVARGLAAIERTLKQAVDRGVMRADGLAAVQSRIHGTTRLDELADADLIVEAVFEDRTLKREVFGRLEAVARPDAILATNTSSYLVTDIASAVATRGRVLGLHYFFHAAKNRLVEVVPGRETDRGTVQRAWALQEQLGKIPIKSRDACGFIVNRFLVAWLMEAIRMLDEGLANAATIDEIARRAFGAGMGPFELMNVSGLPIALHAATTVGNAYGPLYAPPPRLGAQVKTGQPWSLAGAVDGAVEHEVAGRLRAATFLAATALVDEGVGAKEDADIGARVGLRWPRGPFEMMNQHGTRSALALVSALATRWQMPVALSLAQAGRANLPFELVFVRSRPESGVMAITVNRPDAMNALNEAVVSRLSGIFRHAAEDASTRGVVIRGAGRSFVAGADIRFFIRCIERRDFDALKSFTAECQALLFDIQNCRKPVVARVHGLALGGGVELALACDYIVATPDASLGFPETGIGIYPGLGGTQRTTRRIGTGLTKWLVLTGQIIAADQALAIGLIDGVARHEDIDAAVVTIMAGGPTVERRPAGPPAAYRKLAEFFDANDVDTIRLGRANTGGDRQLEQAVQQIAGNAPVALRLAASLVDQGARVSLEDGLRMEVAHVKDVFSTKDALAGLMSIGKPRPVFEGR